MTQITTEFIAKLEALAWNEMLYYQCHPFTTYKIVYAGNDIYRIRKYVHGVKLCCWLVTTRTIIAKLAFMHQLTEPPELSKFETRIVEIHNEQR